MLNRRGFVQLVLAAIAAPKLQGVLRASNTPWKSKPIGWLALIDDTGNEWYGPGYERQPVFAEDTRTFIWGPLNEVPGRMVTGVAFHTDGVEVHQTLENFIFPRSGQSITAVFSYGLRV